MAITLVGEVVNQCDASTGFNTGAADTDIYIEPNASIGVKTSNATTEMYTTSLGASAPYNFASGGGEFGYHIIMWFNGLTPVDTIVNGGMAIIVGNGTDRGQWYVGAPAGYTGGFISRVVDAAADFDNIAAGTWTLTGNPAQLSNVTQMGGRIKTITAIMGNFNNTLIDQITIGLGVRADAGTVGVPNTFESVRSTDQDTNYWGWWTGSYGNYIGQGKLFLGPASGTATSVFNDSAQVVVFAAAPVAVGFYEIAIRGANTDADFSGMVIRSEDPSVARWSLTVDGTSVPAFNDDASLFQGFDTITLQTGTELLGTILDDGSSIIQNSGTLDGCTIINANTTTGNALITSNNPTNIKNCNFTQGVGGHAIECTQTGTYSWVGNTDTGYTGTRGTNLTSNSGSNDAMFYNNSGGLVTLNVSGGAQSPSVRNGAGATTQVNATFTLTLTDIPSGVNVTIVNSSTRTELQHSTSTGANITYDHSGGETVDILLNSLAYDPNLSDIYDLTLPNADSSIKFQLISDTNYVNP